MLAVARRRRLPKEQLHLQKGRRPSGRLFYFPIELRALEFGIHPLLAVLMGGITGVGGGTIRDVLLAQVPSVLRSDFYAAAALAGAALVIVGLKLKLPRTPVTIAGAVLCFVLRVVSVW